MVFGNGHVNGYTNGDSTSSGGGGIASLRNSGLPMSEALRKTVDYMESFVKFESGDVCSAVRDLLAAKLGGKLKPFEIAQIMTLCPEDAEEAKTLIPTIPLDESDMQELLNEINQYRTA